MSHTKTEAEKLFDVYAQHRAEVSKYFQDAQRAVGFLAAELREYLGLPEEFNTLNGETEQWVRLYSWDVQAERVDLVKTPFDIDIMSDRGELQAAIGVVLAASLNSFPRQGFYLFVRVQPRHGDTVVSLGRDREEVFVLDHASPDATPFCEAFVKALTAGLSKSIYDPASWANASEPGIGFLAKVK